MLIGLFRSIATVALVALLADCAGPLQTMPARAGVSASAMSPAASKQSTLLYVSNVSNVTVYTYNNGSGINQVGTLTGFTSPGGMCTDNAGNVWITDYYSRKVYEYAHGGSTPIATITQHLGYPYACVVDAATGNLAVSYEHPNGHFRDYAEVLVFAPGSKSGVSYGPKNGFYRAYFLMYDGQSNLFATGVACGSYGCARAGYIHLFKLARGQSTFRPVLGARQSAASAIVWVDPFFLMGTGHSGNGGAQALKVQVNGDRATVIGTVPFAQTFLTYGFARRAKLVIVPDFAANAVQIYHLLDGSFFSSFTEGLNQPFSAVVSQKG